MKPRNNLATVSLVLGTLAWLLIFVPFLGLPAIITGHIARGQVAAARGLVKGREFALAGLILGYLAVATSLAIGIVTLFGDDIGSLEGFLPKSGH